MALTINTNSLSLLAQNNLNKSQSALGTSIERLSSGMRINSARDDAAGQAIANRFTSQIRGLSLAARNANDGISITQVTEGALNEINNNLQRIRELAVQAQNGIYTSSDLDSIQNEIDLRLEEINRISGQTQFNNIKVLSSDRQLSIQIGANDGESIDISMLQIDSKKMGVENLNVNGAKLATAQDLRNVEGKHFDIVKTTDGNVLAVSKDKVLNIGANAALGDDKVLYKDATGGITQSKYASGGAVPVINTDADRYTTVPAGATVAVAAAAGADGVIGTALATGGGNITAATATHTIDDARLTGGSYAEITADRIWKLSAETATTSAGLAGISAEALIGANGTYVVKFGEEYVGFEIGGTAPNRTLKASTAIYDGAPGATSLSLGTVNTLATAEDVKGYIESTQATVIVDDSGIYIGNNDKVNRVGSNEVVYVSYADPAKAQLMSATELGNNHLAHVTEDPLKAIDKAIVKVDEARSYLGAVQNRMEALIVNINDTVNNMTAARGRIEDADYATEVSNMSHAQILQQAGISVLVQANQAQQSVLALLR